MCCHHYCCHGYSEDLMLMNTPPPKKANQHPAARALQQQVLDNQHQAVNDNQSSLPVDTSHDVDKMLAFSPQATTNEVGPCVCCVLCCASFLYITSQRTLRIQFIGLTKCFDFGAFVCCACQAVVL